MQPGAKRIEGVHAPTDAFATRSCCDAGQRVRPEMDGVRRGDVVEQPTETRRRGRVGLRETLAGVFGLPSFRTLLRCGNLAFARTVTPTPPLVSALLSSSLLLLEKTGISSFTMADNSPSGACTLTSCTRVAKEAIAFAISRISADCACLYHCSLF
jgi:hypothetical protein